MSNQADGYDVTPPNAPMTLSIELIPEVELAFESEDALMRPNVSKASWSR